MRDRPLVADDDGEDEAVVIGEDVVAVDVTPFVSGGRTAEVVGVPIGFCHDLAAVPVVMADFVAFLPVVVADVLLMLLIVLVAVIGMVLGDGDGGGEREGEC